MKKFAFLLIFLFTCGGVGFYFGWIQFSVPAGMTGVMISRTNGVDSRPIENGVFRWQWQRLIPTNSEIRLFSNTPISVTESITGQLASGTVYGSLLATNPDFSYNVSIDLKLTIKPESLPSLVERLNITNQDELENYVSEQTHILAKTITNALLADSETNYELLSTEQLLDSIDVTANFADLDISFAQVSTNELPDLLLYNVAKNAYTAYEEQLTETLREVTEQMTVASATDKMELTQYEQWAEFLTKYPIMVDLFAVTNGTAPDLTMLENLRSSRSPTLSTTAETGSSN